MRQRCRRCTLEKQLRTGSKRDAKSRVHHPGDRGLKIDDQTGVVEPTRIVVAAFGDLDRARPSPAVRRVW